MHKIQKKISNEKKAHVFSRKRYLFVCGFIRSSYGLIMVYIAIKCQQLQLRSRQLNTNSHNALHQFRCRIAAFFHIWQSLSVVWDNFAVLLVLEAKINKNSLEWSCSAQLFFSYIYCKLSNSSSCQINLFLHTTPWQAQYGLGEDSGLYFYWLEKTRLKTQS